MGFIRGKEKRSKGKEGVKKLTHSNSVYCSLAKCAVRCIWPLTPEGGERRIEGGRQTDSENMKEKMKERKKEKQGHEFNKCAVGNGWPYYIQKILNNLLFVSFSICLQVDHNVTVARFTTHYTLFFTCIPKPSLNKD